MSGTSISACSVEIFIVGNFSEGDFVDGSRYNGILVFSSFSTKIFEIRFSCFITRITVTVIEAAFHLL